MTSFINALASSVGRKYVMGLTGLFLCLFLVIHLAGNLLLYVGPEAYNHYTHSLHEQKAFLIFSEVLLYTAFILHVLIALKLTQANWAARSSRYAIKESKREGRLIIGWLAPETMMFLTGVVVLLFVLLHTSDFKFEMWHRDAIADATPYQKAEIILSKPWRALLYLAGTLMLGFHVSHGFQSCFQSLGLSHPRCNCCIRWCSVAFGWIVAIGFGSFPVIWAFLGGPSGSAP